MVAFSAEAGPSARRSAAVPPYRIPDHERANSPHLSTLHAEFLYECVERTIEVDLPAETGFLKGYDSFRRQVEDIVDMPDTTVDLLFRFLRQNDGRLSRRAREREFAELTEDEVAKIEATYAKSFSG
jgi:hypothetical protein